MKTNFFSAQKKSLYIILGFFSILATSCGSYQNTSYYDRDGIYGSSEHENKSTSSSQNYSQNNQYKDYFSSLQDNEEQSETFTDVENYSSNNYSDENNNQAYNDSYSNWGNTADNVNVNFYGNNWGWSNYWGWNLGWGWNSW